MKGLFKEQEIKNEAAGVPWMKSDTDKALEEYLSGSHPKQIAYKLQRNPKAIERFIEQFTSNERDRVVKYEPFRRTSRRGKRFTENEKIIIKRHEEKGVSLKATARLLQREVKEFGPVTEAKKDKVEIKIALDLPGVGVDIVLSHRYLYHVSKKPIISDRAYDDLKAEETEMAGGERLLSDDKDPTRVESYEMRVRQLALYLLFRHLDKLEGKIKL